MLPQSAAVDWLWALADHASENWTSSAQRIGASFADGDGDRAAAVIFRRRPQGHFSWEMVLPSSATHAAKPSKVRRQQTEGNGNDAYLTARYQDDASLDRALFQFRVCRCGVRQWKHAPGRCPYRPFAQPAGYESDGATQSSAIQSV
jgi:hypothetical protein